MSRTARIAVGAVVAGTFAFVAVVSGLMFVVASYAGFGLGVGYGAYVEEDFAGPEAGTPVTAEVLDVDDEYDWVSLDVRYTAEDGQLVVTAVDWDWADDLPEVGDEVAVLYEADDPEWAFGADDPYLSDPFDEDLSEGGWVDDGLVGGGLGVGGVAGWVALVALLGLVVTAVVTAVRVAAPEPDGVRS